MNQFKFAPNRQHFGKLSDKSPTKLSYFRPETIEHFELIFFNFHFIKLQTTTTKIPTTKCLQKKLNKEI